MEIKRMSLSTVDCKITLKLGCYFYSYAHYRIDWNKKYQDVEEKISPKTMYGIFLSGLLCLLLSL